MKVKKLGIARLRVKSQKKVYYYEHRHGVLKDKPHRGYKLLTGLTTAVFVIGGGGTAVAKFLDYQAARKPSSSLQRQNTLFASNETKPGESEDKHKDAPKKAKEDEALAKDIKSKLRNTPGGQKWSVYVRDINSDRMASINADEERDAFNLASLFLVAPLETKIPSEKWVYNKTGKLTLDKCVVTLINSGDLNCRQAVDRLSDLKNADSVLAGHGFKKTTISNKGQATTAREMGDLLFRLQHSQVLSDKGRRTVFDGLYTQKMREGVTAGCEGQCLVASITAEGDKARHEAAIVTSGKAKYVVVVMTEGASWSQLADLSKQVQRALQP